MGTIVGIIVGSKVGVLVDDSDGVKLGVSVGLMDGLGEGETPQSIRHVSDDSVGSQIPSPQYLLIVNVDGKEELEDIVGFADL